MKKKCLALCAILFFITGSVFAQLPYSKMLDLSSAELSEKKFKYDKNKNRYSLTKSNGLNNTMNILNAAAGTSADSKPHADDYTITIQNGEGDKTSSLSVLFYNNDTYHSIAMWAADNGITPTETNSGKITIMKFEHENYTVELVTKLVEVKAVTRNTRAAAKSIDESYNVYTYTIFTEVEPSSKWHTKEAEKKAKNNLKGKKQNINDMM